MLSVQTKSVVVIEIGTAYTKCGWANEATPKEIIKTDFYDDITPQNKIKIFEIFNKNKFIKFIENLFTKILIVPSNKCKVIIVSSVAFEALIRTATRILYDKFHVLSVVVASSCCLCPFSLGLETALVIDCGYYETRIIPICEKYPIVRACRYLPLGSTNIHQKILKELNIDFLTEQDAENIKVMTCFVTSLERSRTTSSDKQPPPSVLYKEGVVVPGHLRENICDCLVEDQLPEAVIEAIMSCPIDVRTQLAENILLVGGTTMLRGFSSRLCAELRDIQKRRNVLSSCCFKFHSLPTPANCVAWQGGSVAGAVTNFVKSLENLQFSDFSPFAFVSKTNSSFPILI